MRPQPAASTDLVRGYALRVWEWAASGDPVRTAVLIHATGFHSRTWDSVARLLPEDWRVFALDMRGHGASQAPTDKAGANWREMAADLNEWLAQRELTNVVAVGHSMGGAICTIAAATGDRIESLALVDPVLVNPRGPRPPVPPDSLSVAARKRRKIWSSSQEMADSLTGRGAFTHWPREAVERYVRYGLKPTARLGEWELACDPEVEAWCFEHAPTVDPWPEMARASQPTLILRAGEMQGHPSPTGQNAVEVFPNAFEETVQDSDHFIPMRRPDAVAETIMTVARDCSADSPD
ncbi:MAG: alpha/beta hydrolase [Chloroflexi bacterium]|nr:alpha/beta hydrolase [Chloroflexota bacterium]MYF80912.1 alpha/beta hydrolase [Chloroflexota bacterium]MYI03803.1 alpha/beta hydrolase [Chloroflexota bacterium]